MTAHSRETHLEVETRPYLDIVAPRHIRDRLDLVIAARAFRPQIDDLQSDWVATVAAPAFKILHQRRGAAACRSFCAIGTGVGLDALAAIELLEAERVGLTDLFDEVVQSAAANVRRNLRPGRAVTIEAGAGDLLRPLQPSGATFDLILENLPNLPLAEGQDLGKEQTSAAFVPERVEAVPPFIRDWLLVLHYLALVQAREMLTEGGAVVATLGARLPLAILKRMAEAAGYQPTILTYGWKVQGVAEEVIGAYEAWERKGFGPFTFYPVSVLEDAFAGLDPAVAGERAEAIEHDLAPHRLDSVAAWEALARGERIGHTVAVLYATRRVAE
jgi:hypothetical protein